MPRRKLMRCDVVATLALGRAAYPVRLYRGDPDRPAVLVVGDVPAALGLSAPLMAERIADASCERWAIDPDTLIYVEHQPAGIVPGSAEAFDRVVFERRPDGRHHAPRWFPCRRSDVERWIGQRLPRPISPGGPGR